MTTDLGYYIGWSAALVIAFILPLIVVLLLYMLRVNHQLRDIQDELTSFTKQKESEEECEEDADAEYPFPSC